MSFYMVARRELTYYLSMTDDKTYFLHCVTLCDGMALVYFYFA